MYKLSYHAYERFKERVNTKGKLMHHAENWVNQAMKTAVFIELGYNGCKRYRYKDFAIVIGKDDTVVTISYHNDKMVKPFEHDLKDTIKTKLRRMIKPYKSMHRRLLIEMHEAEIRKLKVFNPNTQARIDETIGEIKTQIATVETTIKDLEQLAKTYNVEVS